MPNRLMNLRKTFYLWDLADTLFLERWDAKKSGFPSFNEYVKSLGYTLENIDPRDYELAYERPYREGLFDLTLSVGFREVLEWTNENGAFTTGIREQLDWRAEQLKRKYGFDIRPYIKELHSTFDYGNINKKEMYMLEDILGKKYSQGFTTVVYTDEKIVNCDFFITAAHSLIKDG